MYLTIDNNNYEVIIIHKKIKHTYIRVKEDYKIYVSTPRFTNHKEVNKMLLKEIDNIKKMIKRSLPKRDGYYFLGHKVDVIIVSNLKLPEIYNNKFFVKDKENIDKDYKLLALPIYKERLKLIYDRFEEDIPLPILKIRKMKTRWGVCNRRNNSITINLELIKRDIKYIDYVIIHELCHFVYGNHSKVYWELVSKYEKDYKKLRKDLRNR